MKYFLILSAAFVFLFSSCTKERNEPDKTPDKLKIGELTTSQNLKATLWSDEQIATGYHKLYLSLQEASGQNVTNAALSITPVMHMASMSHSSPSEQPVFQAASGMYEFAVVFTMPSGTDSWVINTTINGEEKTFNVQVPASSTKLTGTYTGTDAKRYVVSIVPPVKWQVGLNDVDILINQMDGMMNFPAVDGLTIVMTPEMPSMGHGSPNNVDPVSVGKGHYKGKVNYTMTGDWRLHFKISKSESVIIEDATIDILF